MGVKSLVKIHRDISKGNESSIALLLWCFELYMQEKSNRISRVAYKNECWNHIGLLVGPGIKYQDLEVYQFLSGKF